MHLLPNPEGFEPFSIEKEVTTYKRNLPHWRQTGATYLITFHLNDSLPVDYTNQLKDLRDFWERNHPKPHTSDQLEALSKQIFTAQEKWLDKGLGSCHLKLPTNRKFLSDALHHFDNNRYQLGAYVIMPNHSHIIARPIDTTNHPLEKIIQSWKRFSSREINKLQKKTGSLWFEECYDRIIRDTEHLDRCIQYIGRNPIKADLQPETFTTWLNPAWQKQGWHFRQ